MTLPVFDLAIITHSFADSNPRTAVHTTTKKETATFCEYKQFHFKHHNTSFTKHHFPRRGNIRDREYLCNRNKKVRANDAFFQQELYAQTQFEQKVRGSSGTPYFEGLVTIFDVSFIETCTSPNADVFDRFLWHEAKATTGERVWMNQSREKRAVQDL